MSGWLKELLWVCDLLAFCWDGIKGSLLWQVLWSQLHVGKFFWFSWQSCPLNFSSLELLSMALYQLMIVDKGLLYLNWPLLWLFLGNQWDLYPNPCISYLACTCLPTMSAQHFASQYLPQHFMWPLWLEFKRSMTLTRGCVEVRLQQQFLHMSSFTAINICTFGYRLWWNFAQKHIFAAEDSSH